MKKTIFLSTFFLIIFSVFFWSLFYLEKSIKKQNFSSIILDSSGIEIWEIITDNKTRYREINFREIPDFYKKLVIYREDRSFYNNYWISIRWIVRSLYNNISWSKTQWASTISTQFIRNSLWLNENRWFGRKTIEFYYAFLLNLMYSKNEILTLYANQLYYWYLNYWFKSAAKFYFDKEPKNLTKAEIVALFTISKNSNIYDPFKKNANFNKRFDLILSNLYKNSQIAKKEYEDIKLEKISFIKHHQNKLPYIVDYLKKNEINSKIIKTTIDYNLTKKIEEIANNAVYELSWKNVGDYWILIFDKKTKKLKVMIWWKNYNSKNWQVNSTLALRQPGSTIKPFTYLLATQKLWYNPDDSILDLPVSYKTKDGYSYEPKNYSTKFSWVVSLWEALAQSINVPAVKILEKVWVDKLLDFLRQVWITSLKENADHYWLALTLWDWEVNLFELTQAYSIFAYSWEFCALSIFENNINCLQIIEKKYTDAINYILSNRYLKLGWYPINSSLDFNDLNVFFKTGTSRNFRDNWTIGYTDNYIIWVWAGNKDATNMKWVSWATGAGEIFGRIVRYLENKNSKTPVLSKTPVPTEKYLEITSPLNWQKFLIDKYLPISEQKMKLTFSTNLDYDKYVWQVDSQDIEWNFWQLIPWNPKFELKLFSQDKLISSREVSVFVE